MVGHLAGHSPHKDQGESSVLGLSGPASPHNDPRVPSKPLLRALTAVTTSDLSVVNSEAIQFDPATLGFTR